MGNKLLRAAANKIAIRLNSYSNVEGLEFTKMVIGIEAFIINVVKLLIIYLLAAILGVIPSTLVIHGAFALIKRYSLGLHALSVTMCAVVSCLLLVIVPWLLQGVTINNIVVVSAFAPIMFSLYLFAPADTKARPLIGKKLRTSHKRKTLICGALLLGITLLIPNESVKFLLTLGAVYQVIAILPLTYKILKRSEKNYEKFEQRA